MRTLLATLLTLATLPSLAADWSAADTGREAVYLAFHAADWLQTRGVAKNGWQDGRQERNVILGKHPTAFEVDRYMAATALAHVGVAAALPSEWRPAFQYISIGFEGGVVLRNVRSGVHIKF